MILFLPVFFLHQYPNYNITMNLFGVHLNITTPYNFEQYKLYSLLADN